MGLREFLAELRHRGVLKVATVYVASGVMLLEAGSHLLHNFEAPHWVIKLFTAHAEGAEAGAATRLETSSTASHLR
jgi:hypothetical protein